MTRGFCSSNILLFSALSLAGHQNGYASLTLKHYIFIPFIEVGTYFRKVFPVVFLLSWQMERHSRTGTGMLDFIEEWGTEQTGRWTFCNCKFVFVKSEIFMFVCKIYINADTVTVRNYNNEQPQLLISLRTFLRMYSCLSSCVRSTLIESRADYSLCCGKNMSVVFVTVHEEPFPLLH